MSNRAFSRGQTQVLYRFLPGAIFEHDDYGLCLVDSINTVDPGTINYRALFETLTEALRQWDHDGFCAGFPDPRSDNFRKMYRIGQPSEVRFSPFPRVMKCRKCNHIIKYDTLKKNRSLEPGRCPRPGCDGRLSQLGYVEVHNCGRLEEIHIPDKGCPQHGTKYLRFFDPGRTQKARWVCGECGREIQKARMTPCNCSYTAALGTLKRSEYERFLRLYPAGEPGLFIPLVIPFINFSEEDERRLTDLKDGHALLLARLWGVLEERVAEVVTQRNKLDSGISASDPNMAAIIEELRKLNPNSPLLKNIDAASEESPGGKAIEMVKSRLNDTFYLDSSPSRRLVEHIALLDSTDITDLSMVTNRLRQRGAKEQANTLELASLEAMQKLGLANIQVINDFPIAIAAIGYTRVAKDPNRSVLNPFPADSGGKVPLFVIPSETEGLWFKLNPVRVTDWLIKNNFAVGPLPETEVDSWAWLVNHVHWEKLEPKTSVSGIEQAIITLLHTMSHVLIQRVEWSGFSSSSIGEYLMPETLSFIIFANRFAESKIGGLTTLFEQRLPYWLEDTAQASRDCVYDPLCREDGGSCVSCLYREHNCPFFNRHLSRAVLYGGALPPEGSFGKTTVKHGYWTPYAK